MAYQVYPDCGERVYSLGCVWCNEEAYIAEQDRLTDLRNASAPALDNELLKSAPTVEGDRSAER